MSKPLALLFLLLAVAQWPAFAFGQDVQEAQSTPSVPSSTYRPSQTSPRSAATTSPQAAPAPASAPVTPPQIVVTSPPPANAPWAWHDKVLWGAEIVLVILGYAAVVLALRSLKYIQRQTDFGVAAAQAALQCANAALESSQAIVDSGRPWIVISVEPFLTVENGFKVMATNRGRTPARIIAKADCAMIAADETKLPPTPDYTTGKSSTPFEPIILLPGESAGIRPFRRTDVRPLCESEEQVRRIERWEEKVFVYGSVTYRDLISPLDQPDHETHWCCWYVYGEKDALVISGPPEYNKHS
jgi:type II secretory pathway pseudopilin PulG